MRIAISGTHGCGKTTLINDFIEKHPEYSAELEPYWELSSTGYTFDSEPSVADMDQQLETSARMILASQSDELILFDRSPFDYLAYSKAIEELCGNEWKPTEHQMKLLEKANEALDLVVFVPLTSPDEVSGSIQYPKLRGAVDRYLRGSILGDLTITNQSSPSIVEISGTRSQRVEKLYAAISDLAGE